MERASSHILLVKNQSDSEEGLREKASQLRERVLSGESFEELARSFSDDEVSAMREVLLVLLAVAFLSRSSNLCYGLWSPREIYRKF